MRNILLPLLAVFSFALSCAPKFQAPASDAPHALVELRMHYHVESDALLSQTVEIDGQVVPMSVPRHMERAPMVTRVRVAPGSRDVRVTAELARADTVRQRGPAVVHSRPSCPGGITACEERRIQDEDRWATDFVIEARCMASLAHLVEAGGSYRVQYDFYGADRCTLQVVN